MGPLTLIGGEDTVRYDRPNLSKDYLAGTAAEEWIPLRPAAFYEEQGIRLVLGRRVVAVDVPRRRVLLDDATSHEFGVLLLATGAEPIGLPKSAGRGVRYLRTLADGRAIIAAAAGARRAVVLGASFIGLEVAASLRARDSRSTLSRRIIARWSECWGASWATSSVACTRRTGWFFTWGRPRPGSTPAR